MIAVKQSVGKELEIFRKMKKPRSVKSVLT